MAVSDRSIRNPLVVKLSQFAPLSDEDVGLLEALCLPEERFRAGANIVAEAEAAALGVCHHSGHGVPLPSDARRKAADPDHSDARRFLRPARLSAASLGPLGRHDRPDPDRRNRPRGGDRHHCQPPPDRRRPWWSAMQEDASSRKFCTASCSNSAAATGWISKRCSRDSTLASVSRSSVRRDMR